MSVGFVLKRLLLLIVIVWAAATLIFLLPNLAPGRNPVRERLAMKAATGSGSTEGIEQIVATYEAKFGLDQPLWKQYIEWLKNVGRLDFGTSLALFPSKVSDLILQALPWTIGLLGMATVIAFTLGSLVGAILAWPGAPRAIQYLFPPLMVFSAIPYFLLGLILIFVFAFTFSVFPISGGSSLTSNPGWSFSYIGDILYHSLLPASSVVLSALGFWALGMRGMMVTVARDDYVTYAEARGLKPTRIFAQYAMRNALLPQVTNLALALGHVISGLVLVEVIFRYPGIGTLLFKAISAFDFFLIYGVVFVLIVCIAFATLVVDLIYPVLDPRIRYQRT